MFNFIHVSFIIVYLQSAQNVLVKVSVSIISAWMVSNSSAAKRTSVGDLLTCFVMDLYDRKPTARETQQGCERIQNAAHA